jgi:hypothetical protein
VQNEALQACVWRLLVTGLDQEEDTRDLVAELLVVTGPVKPEVVLNLSPHSTASGEAPCAPPGRENGAALRKLVACTNTRATLCLVIFPLQWSGGRCFRVAGGTPLTGHAGGSELRATDRATAHNLLDTQKDELVDDILHHLEQYLVRHLAGNLDQTTVSFGVG